MTSPFKPPPAERLTKGHIPKSQDGWAREVRGIKQFLARIDAMSQDHSTEWSDKMTSYYRLRLQDLLNNPPEPTKRRRSRGKRRNLDF